MGSDLESSVNEIIDAFLQSITETLYLGEGSILLQDILNMPVVVYRDFVTKYIDVKKKVLQKSEQNENKLKRSTKGYS